MECCSDVDVGVEVTGCDAFDYSCHDAEIRTGVLYTCDAFTGDITMANDFEGVFDLAVQFPYLVSVAGDMLFENVQGLTAVTGGDDNFTIGGALTFDSNNNLGTIELPSLISVGADVRVVNNNDLMAVVFQNVRSIGVGQFLVNPQFIPVRWSAQSVALSGNPNLASVMMPSLAIVKGSFEFDPDIQDIRVQSKFGYMQVYANYVYDAESWQTSFRIDDNTVIRAEELATRASELGVCSYVSTFNNEAGEYIYDDFSDNCISFGEDCRCEQCNMRGLEFNDCSCVLNEMDGTCECPVHHL